MNDDELRRLIAADIADHVADSGVDDRLHAALAKVVRRRVSLRIALAIALVAAALIALSLGYWLAAAVLPPFSEGGFGLLLWAPLIIPAMLVIIALRSALMALSDT